MAKSVLTGMPGWRRPLVVVLVVLPHRVIARRNAL